VDEANGLKQDAGDGKMKEISDYIYEGALAFKAAEYRLLKYFAVIASVVLRNYTIERFKHIYL
jgi:K(+)-stimulated pyrophosphate-energized sodium pump